MALITKAEVKVRIGIATSDTSQDNLIDAMIEDLVDWLPEYLNNPFINLNLYYQASTISFNTKTISDSDSQFVEEGFVDGMDIYVWQSQHNNGHYTIQTVSTSEILTVNASFTVEAAGTVAPIIYQVQFPKGIRSVVSNMIKYQTTQAKQGLSSEKIGNYSVSYSETPFSGAGVSAYPSNIIGGLTTYRKLKWR